MHGDGPVMNVKRVAVAATIAGVLALVGCSSSYQPAPLTNSTPCGVLTADRAAGDTADVDNYLQSSMPLVDGVSIEARTNVELSELTPLIGECASNPTELLSAALNKAVDASLSSSEPTP